MNIGKAIAIFKNINDSKWTDAEKGAAIYNVLRMPTKNSITKQDMEDVVRYMWDMVFTMVENEEMREPITVFK